MRINFVFPMVWPTAVCRTLHAFSNECYYKACQVKKNLCCLPDLLVAILSLSQHNNRMQNSRIFLVFLLSFLSFFLSFVFFLKAGRGGGGRSWMWKGFKRAWIIARYYVCLRPQNWRFSFFSWKLKSSATEKLQQQTEILTNTEISGPPCAFLISVDL